MTQTALGFDGEATRKMRAFLQGPKPELLHHQKFFENGTAERAKESGTEQNYNMIDPSELERHQCRKHPQPLPECLSAGRGDETERYSRDEGWGNAGKGTSI